MKVRNVKIIANLKGMDKKYQPLYRKVIENMVTTLESSHWDNSWSKTIKKYKTRLEGETNSRIKKLSDKELALLIFDKIEKDKNGVTWHIVSDFDIRTYNGPSNVIGYGLASDDITRVNIKFLVKDNINNLNDLKDGGSNLVHEKMHDRGCGHDSKATPRRPNSAAYLSGTVFKIAYDLVFKESMSKKTNVQSLAKSLNPFIESQPLLADVIPTKIDENQKPETIVSSTAPVADNVGSKFSWKFWESFRNS